MKNNKKSYASATTTWIQFKNGTSGLNFSFFYTDRAANWLGPININYGGSTGVKGYLKYGYTTAKINTYQGALWLVYDEDNHFPLKYIDQGWWGGYHSL